MNNTLNVYKRKKLIVSSFLSLSKLFSLILRTPEVRITIALLLVGFMLVFGKSLGITSKIFKSISFETQTIQKQKIYSFKNARFGFQNDLPSFDIHKEYNLEKNLLNTLPLSIRSRAQGSIKAILKISEFHQVDPIWITSVAWTESHFDSQARSVVGARGLMQVMPKTQKYLYKKLKKKGKKLLVEMPGFKLSEYYSTSIASNERQIMIKRLVNIELGVIYLKSLLKRFNNDHKIATIAYNMGPSWTRRRLALNQPVGSNNKYLDKVRMAYKFISKRI